ncbi:MAG: hypothetical protein SGI88_05840 [Candidatus Hydrogenedentes bacterium]|nr:hypothetical protein [Candidatus Hydrogenedentota bacterium]
MVRVEWIRRAAVVALAVAFGAAQASFAAEAKKEAAPAAAGDTAPLDIKLPPPYFGGTPLDYFNEHLEEKNFKPREPFAAPKGATILSSAKTVSSSDPDPTNGKLSMITDGEKGYQTEYLTELGAGTQWVQIDLGQQSDIYAVLAWHFHAADRVYFDFVVRTADDAEFTKNVQTVYNNDYDNSSGLGIGKDKEYIESYEGRLINALKDGKPTSGRFVRLYSKGNTSDDTNHYVEVEVWGKPAAGK